MSYVSGCQVHWDGTVSATFSAEPSEIGVDGLPVTDGLRISSLIYDVPTSTEYIRRDVIRRSTATALATSPSSVQSSSPTALSAPRILTAQRDDDVTSSPTHSAESVTLPIDGGSPMKQDAASAPSPLSVSGVQKRKAMAELSDESFGASGGRWKRSKSVTIQDTGVKVLDFADSLAQSASETIDWGHCCVPPPVLAVPSVSERSLRVLEVSPHLHACICLVDSFHDN